MEEIEKQIFDWIDKNFAWSGSKLHHANECFKVEKSSLYGYSVSSLGNIGKLEVIDPEINSFNNDGLFTWLEIKGNVDFSLCEVRSLVGSPMYIRGDFTCMGCRNLESLEGGPKEIRGNFNCNYCKKLRSLKGAPRYGVKKFFCKECPKLRDMKDAPRGCELIS